MVEEQQLGSHALAKRDPQDYNIIYSDGPGDEGVPSFVPDAVTLTITRTINIVPQTSVESRPPNYPVIPPGANNYGAPYPGPGYTVVPVESTTSLTTSTSAKPQPTVEKDATSSTPEPVGGTSTNKPGLSVGAFVGIVVLCLAIFFGGLFFLIRRRYVKRRKELRKGWSRSKGSQFAPLADPLTEQKGLYGLPSNIQKPSTTTMSSAAVPPQLRMPGRPPSSYGSDYVQYVSPAAVVKQSPSPTSSNSKVAKSPTYGPPSTTSPSSSLATVISTFITTLPDELAIIVGESVRVLAEYDDGWALCLNGRGEQGMIPMECLSGRFQTPEEEMKISRGLGGNARRVSSLQPTIGNVRRF